MIELLPPHIANQIAAGEVVQRGASIVKELVENAVDSGATRITVRVDDGGRTLIQVIDNGCGMSQEDASLAFLRHATSKIKTAEDLFALRTFGFRGEALASIASVAEVELITKREEDEVGVRILVRDGVEIERELCGAADGTTITVRNLFYSIPARRKFLKTDAYEGKLCRSEFQRVAMINEHIAFEYHDSAQALPQILPIQNRHSRIVALTRATYMKKLLPLDVNSPLLKISGYVGTPDAAKVKGRGEQFLFVNGRYFRNPRIFKTICSAYDRLISANSAPIFFVYLTIDESQIDVNINPTKTEVRFEDEDTIIQMIGSAVRQTLGKHNVVDIIDFTPSEIDIPTYNPGKKFAAPPAFSPKVTYDPFDNSGWENESIPSDFDTLKAMNDESYIFSSLDDTKPEATPAPTNDFISELDADVSYVGLQFGGGKYLAVDTISGLAVVNIARARCRIAYEDMLNHSSGKLPESQFLAVGYMVELSAEQKCEVMQNLDLYEMYGFRITDDGGTSIKLMAMPDGIKAEDFLDLLSDGDPQHLERTIAQLSTENILKQAPSKLTLAEISSLFERLMACEEPSFTPSGLKVIEVIDDFDNRFKR